jgi:hypothetical protein
MDASPSLRPTWIWLSTMSAASSFSIAGTLVLKAAAMVARLTLVKGAVYLGEEGAGGGQGGPWAGCAGPGLGWDGLG